MGYWRLKHLVLSLAASLVVVGSLWAGDLRIEPMAAYNFVVDSNVESPSTYAPRSAYVGASFHNDGTNVLTDVWAYIGDYTNNTPGIYPQRTHTGLTGTFSLTHEGGSLGTTDAARYLGTIQPGESKMVYWLLSYPNLDDEGKSVTGGIKPSDDLYLEYALWSTALDGGTPVGTNVTRTATMRNEISAMANKIFPNGANKVPQEYKDLLDFYEPSWTNAYDDGTPGTFITTEGIWYDLGNVGAGFDNDGDLIPDRNAWLQPVGDPTLFDASCFRLVRTYALVIVLLNDGTEAIYEVEDQLYFEHIPENNRGAVGYVRYDFLTLRSGCSSQLTPYQEVASGFDNEKFNGDYGAFLGNGLSSGTSSLELDKTADTAVTGGGSNIVYTITFTNTGSVSVGQPDLLLPLTVQDSIPAGTVYVAASATNNNTLPFGVTNYTVYYSTNSGVSWVTTEPIPATTVTDLQWWLSDPLSTGAHGVVTFGVLVDVPAPPLIHNVAGLSFGDTLPFLEDDATTLVVSSNTISGTVFEDTGVGTNGVYASGIQDGSEPGISNVLVSLYYDINANDTLDDADVLFKTETTTTSGDYTFTNVPNGNFLVVVDDLDSDIPAGYTLTMPGSIAITINDADATGHDFGFAPGLGLTKTGPALLEKGGQAVYTITVTNLTPNTVPGPSLAYTNWATRRDVSLDVGAWLNDTNVLGNPDGLDASVDISSQNDAIGVTGFGPEHGVTVTNVKLVVRGFVESGTADARDAFSIFLYTNGVGRLIQEYAATAMPTAASNLVFDVTTNLSSLAWSVLTNASVQLSGDKGTGPGGSIVHVDAVGLIVGYEGPVAVLDTVPLQDFYDTNVLQFAGATPTVTTNDFTGPAPNTGRLYWENVGPLDRGAGTNITVSFNVIGPAGNAGTTTTNSASVTNATYNTGVVANEASDEAESAVPATGSIGDTIFWDANTNGTQDYSESGIPGVTVELYLDLNSNGLYDIGETFVTNAVTDADGLYLFDQLSPDSYVVVPVTNSGPLVGVSQSADPGGNGVAFESCDGQHGTYLASGQTFTGADFGYFPRGVIGDLVWIDTNTNGVQDAGESGIAYVPVVLYSNGTAVATNQTDIEGYYYFINLPDGTYDVSVLTTDTNFPSGLGQVYDRDGTIDDTASNIVMSNGVVTTIDGTPVTEADLTVDFGYRYAGDNTLSGTIGFDAVTYDGVLNGTNTSGVASNEAAYAGVPVYLYLWNDADSNGVVNTGETIAIGSTQTSTNGDYSFSNLPEGDGDDKYIVASAAPDTYLKLTTTNGSIAGVEVVETTDGQNNTVSAYLAIDVAQTITGMDFAYRSVLSYDYGDLPDVYQTLLPDGARHVLPAATNLYLGTTVDADDNGQPSADASGDGGDEDGVLSLGVWQGGVDGGAVQVTVGSGSGWLLGYIDFDNDGDFTGTSEMIISEAVSAGTATNAFTIPAGAISSTNRMTLYARFRLFESEPTFTALAFAGETENGEVEDYLWAFGAIGDFVWRDLDGDGVQDAGENGIEGIRIFVDVDNNGMWSSNEVSTLTDSQGWYSIGGFVAGTNNIAVDTNTIPLGFEATYDLDDTGTLHTTEVVLTNGQVRTDVDFGYMPPSLDLAVTKTANKDSAYDVGELVTFTITLQNLGPADGTGIELVDFWPSGVTFSNATPSQGSYDSGSHTWTVGSVVSGSSAGLVITGVVAVSGHITNTVAVSAVDQYDSNTSNNTNRDVIVTQVLLSRFDVVPENGAAMIEWETDAEFGTIGFFLYRQTGDGASVRVNQQVLPGLLTAPQGGVYRYLDRTAPTGVRLQYYLEEIEADGARRRYGPFTGGPLPTDNVSAMAESVDAGRTFTRTAHGAGKTGVAVQPLSVPSVPAGEADRIRMLVQADGLYRVTFAAIATTLGMSLEAVQQAAEQQAWALSSRGKPVAWRNDGAGLLFYGQALPGPFCDYNVYWLASGQGVTMAESAVAFEVPTGTPSTYTNVVEVAEDHYTPTGLFTNPAADIWVWDYLVAGDATRGQRSYPFLLDHVVDGEGVLKVLLRGSSSSVPGADHHVLFALNGQAVGETRWSGATAHTAVCPVPAGVMVSGTNTLEITAQLDPGVSVSIFYLDHFVATHQRQALSEGACIAVPAETGQRVEIDGFLSGPVWLLNVTDSLTPEWLDVSATEGNGGDIQLAFTAPESGIYVALSSGQVLTPEVLGAAGCSWRDKENCADYLVIAPASLWDASLALCAYRASHGANAVAVPLQDIFDAFNYGLPDPRAIRAFLGYAYRYWARAPRYVVLAGDGTYDYRNVLGKNDCLNPPLLVSTKRGLQVSDAQLADATGDGVPDMAIGRIPVDTPGEMAAYVAKLKAYEQGGAWRSRALMLSDNSDAGGDFEADSARAAALIDAQAIVSVVVGDAPIGSVRDAVVSNLNAGVGVFHYMGHGGMNNLASEGAFRADELARLSNSNMPPIMIAVGCSFGQFSIPGWDALSESMVSAAHGGAVAVWAPCGAQYHVDGWQLDQSILTDLANADRFRFGAGLLGGLSEMAADGLPAHGDVLYNLLGDPATAIQSPDAPLEGTVPSGTMSFDEWRRLSFAPVAMSVSGRDVDPDGDGVVNFFAYALGQDPANAATQAGLTIHGSRTDASGALDLTFRMRAGVNLQWRVDACDDLKTGAWFDVTPHVKVRSFGPVRDTMEDITVSLPPLQAETGRGFFRMVVFE